jgi:copper chaperone
MKILKFKTNIMDQEMVAQVAPALDQEDLISKWNLDTNSAEKILSVSGEEITPEIVKNAIEGKGFQAELLNITAIGGHDL